MTTYAVTAASGHLGRLAVHELLNRGTAPADVVAVVRTPDRVADLADLGVLVRKGDYADPAELLTALRGVDRLLLISGGDAGKQVAQQTNVIEAAAAAGVRRIAYTSVLRADTSTNPVAPQHKETEAVLAASGVPFSALRNGWYQENYTEQLSHYLAAGEIVGATHGARISAASRADYAAAAAAALLIDDDADHVYELGGDPFTLAEFAAAVTEVTGTTVTYRDLDTDQLVAALRSSGLDEATADLLAEADAAIAAGDVLTDRMDLRELIGRPTTSLIETLNQANT